VTFPVRHQIFRTPELVIGIRFYRCVQGRVTLNFNIAWRHTLLHAVGQLCFYCNIPYTTV